ncbi:hypothetical protein Droror1_Dr00012806 [Drosera rotundifolia]
MLPSVFPSNMTEIGTHALLCSVGKSEQILQENLRDRPQQHNRDGKCSIVEDIEPLKFPLVLAVALGVVGVILFKSFLAQK